MKSISHLPKFPVEILVRSYKVCKTEIRVQFDIKYSDGSASWSNTLISKKDFFDFVKCYQNCALPFNQYWFGLSSSEQIELLAAFLHEGKQQLVKRIVSNLIADKPTLL